MVLYADILFLVDLSMDILTLTLCCRLTHRKCSWLRLLLASVVGALGDLLLVCLYAGRFLTFLTGLTLSALMTAITFGTCGSVGAFLRQYVLVWGSGALAGGCMSVLLSLGRPVYLGDDSYSTAFFATTGMVYGLIRLLERRVHTKTAEVRLTWHGRTTICTVLVDSGNLLCDPLTGRAVILLSAEALAMLDLPTMPPTTTDAVRFYPVPAKGVTGERLLWAFRPDVLTVEGITRDALVAAEHVPRDHYGGYSGTCPHTLCG